MRLAVHSVRHQRQALARRHRTGWSSRGPPPETRAYRKDGDGGDGRDRVFCPRCGSQLYSVLAENAELTWLKVGSLDDAAKIRPTLEVWTASAQPYTKRLARRPSFRHGPPRGSIVALRPMLQALRSR